MTSQLVSEQKFSIMQQELIEIIKILTATINNLKSKSTYYLLLIFSFISLLLLPSIKFNIITSSQ